MFQAQTQNAYIPSKSVAIKPEVVSAVGPGEEIRIHIPSFVGFIDPNKTYLKANLQFQNVRGQLTPDARAGGIHALFRQVFYRDGNNQTTLELNEDYNAWRATLEQFTESPSVRNRRELFEGKMSVVGNKHSEKSLYYAAHEIAAGAAAAAPDTSKRVAHNVMVQAQLHSGIWKQGNIIPVSAMNGMRITLQTDDILRSCVFPSSIGDKANIRTNKILLTTANKTQGSELRTKADAPANNGSSANGYIAITDKAFDENPFAVNDIIYVSNDDAGHTNEEVLGNVLGFFRGGVGNAFLCLNYQPLRDQGAGLAQAHNIGSLLYYKVADREVAHTFYTAAAEGTNVKNGSQAAPTYELSSIEMICQSVQPPPEYVESLLRAAASPSGVQFDIMSYELYRHNQANTTGLVQAVIPTLQKRARALFCQPLATASTTARSFGAHSLTGIVDNAQTYEYIHGTKHMPARLAPLKRYSQVVVAGTGLVKAEAVHMSELQKSIANIGEPVMNLQEIAHNFVLSRSLSMKGGVKDLSEETLSVRVDYLNGTEQKILNNYVVGLRRIMINSQGVMAMYE